MLAADAAGGFRHGCIRALHFMEQEYSRAARRRPYAWAGMKSVIYQRFLMSRRVGDGFPVPPFPQEGGSIESSSRRGTRGDSLPVIAARTQTGRSACGFSVIKPERPRAADSRPYAWMGT